jgi:hypothetical protein
MALQQHTTQPPELGGGPGSLPPEPPYNWRPTLWLIVGILVVVFAMGVFMRVIPTPFTQPSPTAAVRPTVAAAVATAPPTVAPTHAPAAAPTAQPTTAAPTLAPLAAPAATTQAGPAMGASAPQPNRAPTSLPTTALTPAAAAVAEGASPGEPTAEPTVDPALQAEILDAYSRYWQVSDDALATLDASHLSEVMDGNELVGTQLYIDQLRNEGKAAVGPIDHSITLVRATPEDAVIYDRIVDHGVFVDPTSREPLPPEQQAKPDVEVVGYYFLHKFDDTWKVVREEK